MQQWWRRREERGLPSAARVTQHASAALPCFAKFPSICPTPQLPNGEIFRKRQFAPDPIWSVRGISPHLCGGIQRRVSTSEIALFRSRRVRGRLRSCESASLAVTTWIEVVHEYSARRVKTSLSNLLHFTQARKDIPSVLMK